MANTLYFLCTGNSCRSQMAKHMVKIQIDKTICKIEM